MSLKSEINRKIFHFAMILAPIYYYYQGKEALLKIILPISLIIFGLDFARQKNEKVNQFFIKIFAPILRDHEMKADGFSGAGWVSIAAIITFILFKEVIAVTAFTILVLCDGLAAFANKSIKSKAFFEKTIAGALVFAIVGLAILFTIGHLYHVKIWFYLTGFFALFCVTIIECRPSLLEIDDNFTIPIIFGAVMTMFDLMWNYNY